MKYYKNDFLNKEIEELGLTVRTTNRLKNIGVWTIGRLVEKTEDRIIKTRSFGKKSMTEIKAKLAENNLSLGMTDIETIKTIETNPEEPKRYTYYVVYHFVPKEKNLLGFSESILDVSMDHKMSLKDIQNISEYISNLHGCDNHNVVITFFSEIEP